MRHIVLGLLVLLFIAVPLAEIYLILEVGGWLGALPTIAILVATALAGAALARHQGVAAWRRMQRSMARGRQVGRSIVEAALVLIAAVLLVTPGFLTDLTGLALLAPPIRRRLAGAVVARLARRLVFRPGPGMPPYDVAGPDPDHDPGAHHREQRAHEHDPPPPGVIDVQGRDV